jgi:NAD(P)-dependent dehydrogenase (short-subunit alcohol dehydrogenase family)
VSIIIIGAGPNLGAAVARRFGSEGMPVGLIARNHAKLDALAGELRGEGITTDFATADIRDAPALTQAIATLAERLGPVEVLEYSPLPAREFMKPILETTVEDVRGPLEFSVLGAVAAATAVIGPMLDAGRGTILFTAGGAAIHPLPTARRRRSLLRRRSRLRAHAARRVARPRHPRRAHRDRRTNRTRRRPRARRRRRRALAPPHRTRRFPGPARDRLMP